MSDEIKLIQPAHVARDEYGHWFHPDLPTFSGSDECADDSPNWTDWIKEQALEVSVADLEDEPEDHPAYIRYFDEGDGHVHDWDPKPPHDDGWFTLGIFDTDDGPRAWFVRRATGSAQ